MIALAVLADNFTIAGFCLVSEWQTEISEQTDLVLALIEQLLLASMVGRLELRAGDSTIGDNRFAIRKLNCVSFLSTSLAHLLISNCENFG